MGEFNILSQDVPVGNTAVANLFITAGGVAEDVDTVQTVWKDHTGTTIIDLTWSGSLETGTGINGEDASIDDPAGTGTYLAKLDIDSTYSSGNFPKTFTLEVTITDTENGTKDMAFTFNVVATSLTVTLDPLAVSTAVKREAELLDDVQKVIRGNGADDAKYNRVSLSEGIVYEVEQVILNGVEQELTTDYTWSTYRPYIEFVNDLSQGDSVYVEYLTTFSSAYVDSVIDNVTRILRPKLDPYYTQGDLANSVTFQNMVRDMAVGRLLMQQVKGAPLESARWRRGKALTDDVMELVKKVQQGGSNLLDQTLGDLQREAGSLVGGATLQSSSERRTREDIIESLQDYDPIIIDFSDGVTSWPESRF